MCIRDSNGTLSAVGSFACSFAIPAGTAGAFPLVATAGGGTVASASVSRTGAAGVSLAPAAGTVGTDLSVGVGGFGAGETVNLFWDGATTAWATKAADAAGALSVNATVPYLGAGAHTLHARGASSGTTASATYTVQPALSLSPGGGAAGATATAYASGFAPGQPIALAWNKTATAAGVPLCAGTVAANGTFSCPFTVPTAPGAAYPVAAAGGGATATAPFQVTAAGAVLPGGTVLGPGTYRITGTREGLVGGTTSSGHVIVPDDHFVSLPACTATSCAWLTPGVTHPLWGRRIRRGAPRAGG